MLIVDDDVRNVFALTSVLEARRHGRALRRERAARRSKLLERRPGRRPRPDGHHDAGAGRLRDDARDPRDAAFETLPIIALTAKAMKGDREKSHRRRRVGLHHQAGRRRPARLADAGVAVRVERAGRRTRRRAATRTTREARARAAARGDLPPLRLRLPRLRAGVAAAPAVAARARRGPADASRRCRSGSCTTRTCMERLLLDLSINVTAMFRDPTLLRRAARAGRAAAAHVSVHRGSGSRAARPARRSTRSRSCCTRRGCYDRTRIYATDINEAVLERARAGVVPARQDAGLHARTTSRAGGKRSFSDYYTSRRTTARSSTARCCDNVVFAQHNLVPTARSTSST